MNEQTLTTYSSPVFCMFECGYICLCTHPCVCIGMSFPLLVLCVYRFYVCVCVCLVRSSAGGDYGGAGEERRQHTGPHHLRRN